MAFGMRLTITYSTLLLLLAILAQGLVERTFAPPMVLKLLHKRSASGTYLPSLGLRQQESFLYGSSGDRDFNNIANMTIYTGDGELIIPMERFIGMLKCVECGDNTVLVLKSEVAFQHAVYAWDWVNEQANNSFLMITNYPECGPDSQRQPYYVHGLHFDEPNLTAYLHAIKRSWSDVAHTFDLDIGQASPPSDSVGLRPRQQASGDSVTWDVTGNFQHDLISYNASGVDAGLSCMARGVGRAVVVGGALSTRTSSHRTSSSGSSRRTLSRSSCSDSPSGGDRRTIVHQGGETPVPIGGLEILNIANLGPTFDLTFGFSASAVPGTLKASYGLTAALSNEAILSMDLLDPGNSKFSGWVLKLHPAPLDISREISANVEAYIQEALGISISALDK